MHASTREDLELLASTSLVTGRYQDWQPGDGVPVRTTVGWPRFWRHGPIPHLKEITPYGVFGKGLDPAPARLAYRQRLDRLAAAVVANLAFLCRAHPDETLCLLCFEDVHAGQPCHRRWFAEWFEEHYGIAVPELPARRVGVGVEQPPLPL